MIADALSRAIEQLEKADQLLSEVFSIGLWTKSDDCSDNRQRRKFLREVDWALSDAYRALSGVRVEHPEDQTEVDALRSDLHPWWRSSRPFPTSSRIRWAQIRSSTWRSWMAEKRWPFVKRGYDFAFRPKSAAPPLESPQT